MPETLTTDPHWDHLRALARQLKQPQWHAFVAFWDTLIAEGKVPYPEAELDGWGDLRLTWQGPGWTCSAGFAPGGESVLLLKLPVTAPVTAFQPAVEGVAELRSLLVELADDEERAARRAAQEAKNTEDFLASARMEDWE